MIALDTNILVRYLTNDDEALARRAERLIDENRCYVSRVVLLETFQVLESFYRLEREQLIEVLHAVFGLEQVVVEEHLISAQAVRWFEAGMEFADALALAAAHDQDELVTFDRDFARISAKLKTSPRVIDARR